MAVCLSILFKFFRLRHVSVFALLLFAVCVGRLSGQELGRDTRIGGFPPRLPSPAPIENDPALPPEAARPFVSKQGSTTTTVEVKVGQGRFLTLSQNLSEPPERSVLGRPGPTPIEPFLAIGDPSVADFYLVDQRHIRLIGKRLGTTDLSITTAAGKTFDFEIQVVADLDVLSDQLAVMFPTADLKLFQVREKIAVQGQARDATQVSRIVDTIEAYIQSIQRIQISGQIANINAIRQIQVADPNSPQAAPGVGNPVINSAVDAANAAGRDTSQDSANAPTFTPSPNGPGVAAPLAAGGAVLPTAGQITLGKIATNQSVVINLIRIPTSQQVLLKVRVAELNRTGFREIGADFIARIPEFGTLFGTQIAGNGLAGDLADSGRLSIGPRGTFFGTFSNAQFNVVLTALRRNNIFKVLAEPNLVALNGHQANFLAGGEFPVPSFSGVGAGSPTGGGTSSTQFKEFGVRLSFLPIILDNDTIRLTVDPEVSSVDFAIATTLVPGGSPVPGLNKRSSHTTVELKQGETLAIAGLMQLELNGSTQRLPGLGDLPYIGAFFSNTTHNRVEKELIVLVTPYLIEPMSPDQVPSTPGDEVNAPNDLEFFFMNRIEGRTGVDKRATASYDDPLHLIRHSLVERKYLIGPSGFSK